MSFELRDELVVALSAIRDCRDADIRSFAEYFDGSSKKVRWCIVN